MMRIRDPASGMETVRIRDPGWKKVGSGISIPDPPHCDPGCGTFMATGSGIRDGKKNLDPAARMNISDLFRELGISFLG
jgi:hypothetical protein